MNIVELINKIKELAIQHNLVHSTYDGDVYTNWNTTEVKFGSVNVGVETIQRAENYIQYDVILYYADRLLQDNQNANAIYADGVNILQSILNQLEDELEITYPIQYTPFSQKFVDYLAGVYCRVSIISEYPLGKCNLDYE